jgi:hypothetical protein
MLDCLVISLLPELCVPVRLAGLGIPLGMRFSRLAFLDSWPIIAFVTPR